MSMHLLTLAFVALTFMSVQARADVQDACTFIPRADLEKLVGHELRDPAEPVQDRDGESAGAQEHHPGARGAHARAFAASSTSSSSPWPTGISSSIDSR